MNSIQYKRRKPTINVRLIGGPANGETIDIDPAADFVQWDERHTYRRRDFAYRLVSGRTCYWRIMVHNPNMTELMNDIDALVCKAFDTFFGPAINERSR